jgi:hypothetical protein
MGATPLRSLLGVRELTRPSCTKDPDEARQLARAVLSEFEAELTAARTASGDLRRLTHRYVVVLCGASYRQEVAEFGDDPGGAEGWEAADDLLLDKLDRDPETGEPLGNESGERDLAEARRFLADRGIAANAASVRGFTKELFLTKRKADGVLRRGAARKATTLPIQPLQHSRRVREGST